MNKKFEITLLQLLNLHLSEVFTTLTSFSPSKKYWISSEICEGGRGIDYAESVLSLAFNKNQLFNLEQILSVNQLKKIVRISLNYSSDDQINENLGILSLDRSKENQFILKQIKLDCSRGIFAPVKSIIYLRQLIRHNKIVLSEEIISMISEIICMDLNYQLDDFWNNLEDKAAKKNITFYSKFFSEEKPYNPNLSIFKEKFEKGSVIPNLKQKYVSYKDCVLLSKLILNGYEKSTYDNDIVVLKTTISQMWIRASMFNFHYSLFRLFRVMSKLIDKDKFLRSLNSPDSESIIREIYNISIIKNVNNSEEINSLLLPFNDGQKKRIWELVSYLTNIMRRQELVKDHFSFTKKTVFNSKYKLRALHSHFENKFLLDLKYSFNPEFVSERIWSRIPHNFNSEDYTVRKKIDELGKALVMPLSDSSDSVLKQVEDFLEGKKSLDSNNLYKIRPALEYEEEILKWTLSGAIELREGFLGMSYFSRIIPHPAIKYTGSEKFQCLIDSDKVNSSFWRNSLNGYIKLNPSPLENFFREIYQEEGVIIDPYLPFM